MTIETFIGSVMHVRSCVVHTAHDHLLITTNVDEIAMFDTMVQAMRVGPGQRAPSITEAAVSSVTK